MIPAELSKAHHHVFDHCAITMMRALTSTIAAVILLQSLSNLAESGIIVMDFEGLAGDVTTQYVEDGFRATPIDTGGGINHFDRFATTPDTNAGLHDSNNATTIQFDFFGSSFDFVSIDVEALFGTSSPVVWTIQSSSGATRILSTVGTESFLGDAAWQNISSVTIFGGNGLSTDPLPVIHFDNVTFNDTPTIAATVPEPSSLALLGMAVLCLAAPVLRSRQRQMLAA